MLTPNLQDRILSYNKKSVIIVFEALHRNISGGSGDEVQHNRVAVVVLASIVIFLYDGTRGNIKGAVAKYSFYAFYPLHLWIINIFQLCW